MTSELQKKLRALREIAPELNAAADEANRVVTEVDNALRDMKLGVSATAGVFDRSVEPIRDEDGEDDEDEADEDDGGAPRYRETLYYLAYGRVQGRYGIHVLSNFFEGDTPRENKYVGCKETEWSGVGRETRMKAFPSLPGLLDGLLEAAKKKLATARNAAQAVKDIIEDKSD
jgi:hypothetical protein